MADPGSKPLHQGQQLRMDLRVPPGFGKPTPLVGKSVEELLVLLDTPDPAQKLDALQGLFGRLIMVKGAHTEFLRTHGSLDKVTACLGSDREMSGAATMVISAVTQDPREPDGKKALARHKHILVSLFRALDSECAVAQLASGTLLVEVLQLREELHNQIAKNASRVVTVARLYEHAAPRVAAYMEMVLMTLTHKGPALPVLASRTGICRHVCHLLDSPNDEVVAGAAVVAKNLSKGEPTRGGLVREGLVPKIVRLLDHEQPVLRCVAVECLMCVGRGDDVRLLTDEATVGKIIPLLASRPLAKQPGLETRWGTFQDRDPFDPATAACVALESIARSEEGSCLIWQSGAVLPLMRLARKPKAERMRWAALDALARLFKGWGNPAVADCVNRTPLEDVLPAVVQAFESRDAIDCIAAYMVLSALLRMENPGLVRAMVRYGVEPALAEAARFSFSPKLKDGLSLVLKDLRRNIDSMLSDVAAIDSGVCYGGWQEYGAGVQRCNTCDASRGEDGGNLKDCGSCLSVSYCSAECQRSDWKAHKKACKAAAAAMKIVA